MDSGKNMVDRLIACGFTRANALDVCQKYTDEGAVLENFIRNAELLYDDRKEYPKEVTV